MLEAFVVKSLEEGMDLEEIGIALEDEFGLPAGKGWDKAWSIANSLGLLTGEEDE